MRDVKKSHWRKPSRSQLMHQRYVRPESLWKRLRLCWAGASALEPTPEQQLCAPPLLGSKGFIPCPDMGWYGGLGSREIPALTLQVQRRRRSRAAGFWWLQLN